MTLKSAVCRSVPYVLCTNFAFSFASPSFASLTSQTGLSQASRGLKVIGANLGTTSFVGLYADVSWGIQSVFLLVAL